MKNKLTKTFYLTSLLFITSLSAFSQTVWDTLPWKSYSDYRLQPLNKGYVNTGILYDRVFPIAQLDERTGLLPNEDTTSSDHFKQGYYEMYNSIYNPSGIVTPDNLESMLDAYPIYNGHPIGILLYKFNSIDTNALENNLLDTLPNGQFVDVANRSRSPYFTNTAFVAAPLKADDEVFEKGEHTFFLDPAFFLHNDSLHITQIRIDFGDGQGEWVVNNPFDGGSGSRINFSIVKNLTGSLIGRILVIGFDLLGNYIQYGNPFEIKVPGGKGPNDYAPLTACKGLQQWVIEAPQSRLDPINTIYGNPQLDYIRKIKDANGNKVTIPVKDTAYFYFAGNGSNCNTNVVRKPIVFIDGFDPTNSRGIKQIYEGYINAPVNRTINGVPTRILFGDYILNEQYDFIILDFKHGNDLLERNAMTVVSLLERLYQTYGANFQQDITIIGPSMGSAIAQYALAYMESNNIAHHVKTYISFDGVHQGANVPIGLQNMIEYLTKRGLLSKLNIVKSTVRNGLYNGLAARQMLAHHTSANAEFTTPDALRNQFLTNLQAVGEYPVLCRKVALINGVSNGILNDAHPNANESLLHIMNKRRGWKSIWGLCNANICKNLDWECKTTPNQGIAKVTEMWTLNPIINLIFWVPPFQTNKFAAAAWGNSAQDNAPGGKVGTIFGSQGGNVDQKKLTFLFKEFFYLVIGSKRTTFSQNINNFTITPSYGSADLRFPSLTNNSNKNLYMNWSNEYLCGHTPFDYVYAPKDINEEHVLVSQFGSEVFESEVRCARPDLPVFFDPNINGSSTVCNAEVYSIPFCQQANHTVTWTVSNQNIATISGSGDQITLNKIGNGTIILSATVTFACSYATPIVVTKQIDVGNNIDPLFEQKTVLCPGGNNQYMIAARVTAIPGATLYRWYIDGVLKITTSSNSASVPGATADGRVHTLQVRIQTPCGEVSTAIPEGRFTAICGGAMMFTASPNPTYSTTTVQIVDETGQPSKDPKERFYELQIADKMGSIKKQFKSIEGLQHTSIDLSFLPIDIYFLRIWDGKEWYSLQIIKR